MYLSRRVERVESKCDKKGIIIWGLYTGHRRCYNNNKVATNI